MVFKYSPVALMLTGVLFSLPVSASQPESTSPTAVSTGALNTTTPATPQASAPASTVAVTTSAAPSASATGEPSPSQSTATPAQAQTVQATVSPGLAPATVLAFTPEQEARIGEVAKAYLLDHPEVLLEVSQKLQTQQHEQQLHAITTAVLAHQDALLNDPSTPSYGPADARVALVEFFDYQCSVCAHQAPIMEALMQANPQVRYVFKEWPIFGARWPVSMDAAETGLQIWKQKGAEAYLTYHNAVFATGHNEGKLTQQDISHASAKVGKLKGKKAEMLDTLAQTDALAQNLGFRGTPGLIVMPVSGATAENVTVVPGGASQETLQAAIIKAGG
ncbi:DSBA-like thioredoxin domain protein [compost metagenome]